MLRSVFEGRMLACERFKAKKGFRAYIILYKEQNIINIIF